MFRKVKWLAAVLLVTGICTDTAPAELIGYWPFDEGQGTQVSDNTGNGNDGTFNGNVEWAPGYKGGGVRFDTAGERIVVGPLDPTAGTNAMTLAAWINWEGQGHSIEHQGIIGKRLGWTTTGDTIKWFWEATPANALLFRADYSGGGTGLWWGNTVLQPYAKEWTHVALTWDNGTAVQYVNGEEVSTGNITFRDTANATPVTIGCVDSTNNETFVGTIDEARIYNHALTPPEIETVMLGIFPTAYRPDPADGAIHADTWVTISWQPGTFAVSHDVYLGDNFDVVNNAAHDSEVFRGNQTTTYYVAGFPGFAYPDGLIPGTTYYWRIDEVNTANPDSPWKGDVWRFSIPSKKAYNPSPADGAESVDVNVKLSWTPGFGAKLHTVYFGDNYDTVANAAGGPPLGIATYSPTGLKRAKTYYWRVDEFDAVTTHKGDVWSFTTLGGVGNPQPANGAVDVKQTPVLSWTAGAYAASHEVYFGADAVGVRNATKTSPEFKTTKARGDETYAPGKLAWETTHYWRIDEVNSTNPDSPWTGKVWSFTTADYAVIDDFEDYDAGANQIWYAWHDGLGYGTPGAPPYFAGNSTGAAVGDETTASFTEETIIHGGNQSMPVAYDNNKQGKAKYSEVELTLTALRDWTEEGIGELSIWFRGLPGSVGSFTEAPAGTYTMTASGTDIWDVGTAGNYHDEFHFAYKTLTGAGSIVARVQSVQNTNAWSKAGVMIRETLDGGSKHAFACITPSNGVASQGRALTGDSSFNANQTGVAAPYWVKLERDAAGNFTVSHSANGTAWQPVTGATPRNIPMSSTVYIGLALTSHDAARTCQTVFTNVTTTGTVSPQWAHQDIGIASNAAEPLYIAVSNAAGQPAVVIHPDPAAATITTWTEWVVPLQAIADQGVNLANVDRLAIGLGTRGNQTTPGGSGKMYFDDVRLYRP
jgi:hypothetical protein